MYSDFVFIDRFIFELSCKNTHTDTHTHTHTDSNEYPIVAFSKNATIIKPRQPPNLKNPPHWEGGGAPDLMRDFLPGKVAEDERSTHPGNRGLN